MTHLQDEQQLKANITEVYFIETPPRKHEFFLNANYYM